MNSSNVHFQEFSIINSKLFILSVIFVITGVVIMVRNRFYNRSKDTMLFPVEVKLFLAGLLLSLIGIVGVVNEILKLANII